VWLVVTHAGLDQSVSCVCVIDAALAIGRQTMSDTRYRCSVNCSFSVSCLPPVYKPWPPPFVTRKCQLVDLVGARAVCGDSPVGAPELMIGCLSFTSVCIQGEVGRHFYIVLSGTAGVYVRSEGTAVSGKKRGALRRLSCVNGDDEVGRLVARIGPGTNRCCLC
jgi:hypothetical protein